MKRYIKSANSVKYLDTTLNVGDRINITQLNGENTDIVGEIISIKGAVVSVQDLYPIEDEDGIYQIDLSSDTVVFDVYLTKASSENFQNTPSIEQHQIIKTTKWYDPEGLYAPNNSGKVWVSGSLEYCTNWLDDMYYDAKNDKYVSVEKYIPGKILNLYYFNAQSNVSYILQ